MSSGELEPKAVFDLASNSVRVAVLEALASAYADSPNDPWVDYHELRDAAGVRDKGNFNYHLDQLGPLVVKRQAGYRLSRVGMAVVSAVASGVFDTEWTWGPVDAPGGCLFCDEPAELRYESGVLRLACGTDGHDLPLSVPPSLLESGPEDDVIDRIAFVENRWGELTRRRICAECHGHVVGEIEYGGRRREHYHYHGDCQRCGFQHGIPVGMFLVSHPAVEHFYYERGVDVRTTPFWTFEWCRPGNETVVSTDPLRLQVDIDHDGDSLAVVLDESGAVVSTERST